MAIAATEAVPVAAEATGSGAAGGAAGGAGAEAAPGMMPPPQPPGRTGQEEEDGEHGPRTVLLAVAIVLLWLAGLAFFIALDGIQVEQGATNGMGVMRSIMGTLVKSAKAQEGGSGSG